MPVSPPSARAENDFGCEAIRRIHEEVLPKTDRLIERGTKSLDKCISLQLDAGVRLAKKIE